MADAQVSDMVAQFGEADMVRLSTPVDQAMTSIVAATVDAALDRAMSLIDSYLRKRYLTPLGQAGQIVPPEITTCCCILARHDLAGTDGRTRGEQVREDFKDKIAWLQMIAGGKVELDVTEAPSGDDSFARMSSRDDIFGPQTDTTYGSYSFGAGNYP